MPFRTLNFRTVIAGLGGPTTLSALLGRDAPMVQRWVDRDSIPGEWWDDVAAVAARMGRKKYTVQALARIARQKRIAREAGRRPNGICAEARP